MTTLFDRLPPAGGSPRQTALLINRIVEYLETQARIFVGADSTSTVLNINAWSPLPLRNVQGSNTPVDFRLGTGAEQDRMIYEGQAPINVKFDCTAHMELIASSNHSLGLRKNGDDGTVVSKLVTVLRGEFSAAHFQPFDLQTNDYVEFVCFVGQQNNSASVTTSVYAQQTGFLTE